MFILIFDEVKFINLFFYESCLWNLIEAVFASLEITRIFFAFTSLGFYVYDLFCINICMQYEVWARVLSFFFFFLLIDTQFFQNLLLKWLSFPIELPLNSCWKAIDHVWVVLILDSTLEYTHLHPTHPMTELNQQFDSASYRALILFSTHSTLLQMPSKFHILLSCSCVNRTCVY